MFQMSSSAPRVSPATARSVPSSNEARSPSEQANQGDYVYFTSEMANMAIKDIEKEKERFDSLLEWHIAYRKKMEKEKSENSNNSHVSEIDRELLDLKAGIKRKREDLTSEDKNSDDDHENHPAKRAPIDANPELSRISFPDETLEEKEARIQKILGPNLTKEASVLWKLTTDENCKRKDKVEDQNPLRKMEQMTNATSFKQPPNLNEMAEMQVNLNRKDSEKKDKVLENSGKPQECGLQQVKSQKDMQYSQGPFGSVLCSDSGTRSGMASPATGPQPILQPMIPPQFAQNSPSYPPVGLQINQQQGSNPFHVHPMRSYPPPNGSYSAGAYPPMHPPAMPLSAGYPPIHYPQYPGYGPMPHPAARQNIPMKPNGMSGFKSSPMGPQPMYHMGYPMVNGDQKGAQSPKMPPVMVHHQMVSHNGSPMHLTPPYCPVDQYPKMPNGMPYPNPNQSYSYPAPSLWQGRMPVPNGIRDNQQCMLMVRQDAQNSYPEPQMNGWPSQMTPNYPPAFSNGPQTGTPNKQTILT
ncbi:hypothetical protein WR25_16971 [Diploscapter pachys]|uniref:Uncharacterized protein n=1 Tax=Diploscapter pachys TaxID=2018661 RepID=A0A2A2KNP1_9BILA|nr:hypothetical protein WR25_16971 [Diploscapter pachys]